MKTDPSLTGTATTKPPLLSPEGSPRIDMTSQTFLFLQEPVVRSELRRIRATDVGWLYHIPFRFEVPPEQDAPTEWQKNLREDVRRAQLKLPPSYEAPNTASISYHIKACILSNDPANPRGETSRLIKMVPVVKEELPLQICSITGKESIAATNAYLIGKAWTGSQGKMVMEVAQPKSLCVPIPTGYDTCRTKSVETRAEIKLRFEPIEVNGTPPKLTRVRAKLRVATRVSQVATSDCPYQIGSRADGTVGGLSVESIPLVGGRVQEVKWHRDLTGHTRGTMSADTPGGRRYLTAALPVRLVLPLKKQYLPTFHSCLISHFYVVVVVLSFRKHGDGIMGRKELMSVEVPVQVSSERFINRLSEFSDESDTEGCLKQIERVYQSG